jgi:hypothetical protein
MRGINDVQTVVRAMPPTKGRGQPVAITHLCRPVRSGGLPSRNRWPRGPDVIVEHRRELCRLDDTLGENERGLATTP